MSRVVREIFYTPHSNHFRCLTTRLVGNHVHHRPKYTALEAIEILREKTDHANASYILDVRLNIDPANIQQHRLIGCFDLPHGSGKRLKIVAFTSKKNLKEEASRAGAFLAGFDDIKRQISRCELVYRKDFHMFVASKETINTCRNTKFLRSFLEENNLMPEKACRTLLEPNDFVQTVSAFATGKCSKFVVSKEGNMMTTIGRVDIHFPNQVLENVLYVVRTLFEMQPTDFGKGPRCKASDEGRYVLNIRMGGTVNAGGFRPLELDIESVLQDTANYNKSNNAR
jgi:ribosomal protein L1